MKKAKKILCYLLCAGAAAAVIVFTAAFLISYDETTNVFVAGNVKIVLSEYKYPGNDSPTVKDLIPYQTIEKNPVVTNTGTSDAYIFLRLTVPAAQVTELDEYGRKLTADPVLQELFYLKSAGDGAGDLAHHFGSGWVEIRSLASGGYYDALNQWTFTEGAGSRTYVFAYQPAGGDPFLRAGESTVPLFETVQYKNLKEQPGRSDPVKVIGVEAFAVQAEYLSAKEEEIAAMMEEENVPLEQRAERRLAEIFAMAADS